MEQAGLPAEVAAFLDAHIDSVPQMEALLLLYDHRDESWTAAQIATRIYTDAARVTLLLRHLHQHRLIEPVAGDDGCFRYDSRGDADHLMEAVNHTYRTQLIAVTRFIHAKASQSVLDFARAFDLKKDR
jgi:hypothetical protein